LIIRRVASLYGEDETGMRCPGDACPRYRSASEPKIDACKSCTTCEGRGPVEKREAGDDAVVDHIRRLALEREACPHLFAKRGLVDWEVELLLVWRDARDQYELATNRKVGLLLEALIRGEGGKGKG